MRGWGRWRSWVTQEFTNTDTSDAQGITDAHQMLKFANTLVNGYRRFENNINNSKLAVTNNNVQQGMKETISLQPGPESA